MKTCLPVLVAAMLSSAACSATPVEPDPWRFPYEQMSPWRQRAVRGIVEADPLEVLIPQQEVRSRMDVYEFLLEELPFTASVVRALGAGKYEIFRSKIGPGDSPEDRVRKRRTCHLNDKEGMQLAAELVYHEPGRWVYYVWGKHIAYVPFRVDIRGRSVIVVSARQEGGVLRTGARVYVPRGSIVKLVPGLVEDVIRRKSAIFTDAAKTVAEAAARNPAAFVRGMRGAPGVDEEILERFRSRFFE